MYSLDIFTMVVEPVVKPIISTNSDVDRKFLILISHYDLVRTENEVRG